MIVVNRAIRIEKISYKLDQCGFSSAKSVMKKISSIRLETNIRLQKVTKKCATVPIEMDSNTENKTKTAYLIFWNQTCTTRGE